MADLKGLPLNPRIYRGSIRHSWLLAHNELEWARRNGREAVTTMLRTELAAHKVCEAARVHSQITDILDPYSRWREHFFRQHYNEAETDRIRVRRNKPERRRAVTEA